jgi:hypothetical protein
MAASQNCPPVCGATVGQRPLRNLWRVDDRGDGTLAEARLYQLVRQPGPVTGRTFEVAFLDPGIRAYAFTFG